MLNATRTLILALICLVPAPLWAQQSAKPFSVAAYAVDAQTLSGGSMTISLWGVEAASPRGTPENLRARAALDDFLADRAVRCVPQGGSPQSGSVRAQCLNYQEKDVGLALITAGLVAVNRRDMMGADLSAPYLQAERQARAERKGIWGSINQTQTAPVVESNPMPSVIDGLPIWAVAGALLIVPMLGFLIIGFIISRGFAQLVQLQKFQIAGTQKREKQLKAREKYVVAAALESEINTNRAKLDAYLIIYEELLKSLRDPSKTPKYKRAGDIIHDKPALTRTVYDSNLDKVDLLGPQLTSDLSQLYLSIDPNPDYRTLEPEMAVEKVWEIVERIIRNAEHLIEPMDKISGALNVIVRDRRGVSMME
ncbi:MAG TPA: hypothetical protein VIN59_08925 [Alphaproteobacteria bacterium]